MSLSGSVSLQLSYIFSVSVRNILKLVLKWDDVFIS